MKKTKGIVFILLGLLLFGYNYFFRATNITSSAVLQLEDSDFLYGIGARATTAPTSFLLNMLALVIICYGVYKFFNKEGKINKE